MIIIKISGGLGNQLFQYAYGKYLSLFLQTEVKYDVNNENNKNFTKRDLDIDKFSVDLAIATSEEVNKFIFIKKGILRRVERKLAQKMPFFFRNYIVQKNAHSLSNIYKDDCYYEGYWQCSEYMEKVREDLLSNIRPNDYFYEKHSRILKRINESNSVAIHIRRGDYISIKVNSKLFEICEMKYYKDAMEYIESQIPNPNYFIFTQDIEWTKKKFKNISFELVSGNSAIDDLLLMSFCKHNIIANSTFSWWGAWLNKNKNKIVIAPQKWYKGIRNSQTDFLIPINWIRL